jgi:hypothetical protein
MKQSNKTKNPPECRDFERLTRKYLEEMHELFPQHASELGLPGYDGKLGKNNAETHLRHIALMERALAATEALPEAAFSGDDWLDRRGFLSMLRSGLLFERDLAWWQINPQAHCDAAVGCIFDLVTRHATRLRAALPDIESRLELLPGFLKSGAAVVKAPVPLWTSLARKTCAGAAMFLTEIERKLTPLSTHPEKTAALFEAARDAFAKYAKAIAAKRPGRPGGFAVGRENMEMLVRERLGFPASLAEIEASGWRLVRSLEGQIREEAKKFGKKSPTEILRSTSA